MKAQKEADDKATLDIELQETKTPGPSRSQLRKQRLTDFLGEAENPQVCSKAEEIIEENLTEQDSTIFQTTTKKLNKKQRKDMFRVSQYGHQVLGVPQDSNPHYI